MPKVPGVTKDHSKQRVETHLRRRRLPVCVVGSKANESQALRGRGLCGKECALHSGESPSHTFLWPCHPPSLPTHFVLKLNSGWLIDWWMLKSLKSMYTGWQRILKEERKISVLFRFWHHSYIRHQIRSSVCALLVDMNHVAQRPCCAPSEQGWNELQQQEGSWGADQAPYRGDRGNLT